MKTELLTILTGDCREKLKELSGGSVQCCVTSPPYWGLRDYGHRDQIGQEESPDAYVQTMRNVFAAVWRVLKSDGTLWLNLGDSYARNPSKGEKFRNGKDHRNTAIAGANPDKLCGPEIPDGLKPKDLCMIPAKVAIALQNDGWYLRSDIIWAKPNCMPESVTDRPTRSHEYIFLLTKSERYFYDHEAIKEPPSPALLKQIADGYNGEATKDFAGGQAQDASATKTRIIDGYRAKIDKQRGHSRRHDGFNNRWDGLTRAEQMACGSNKRDVWTVAPANFKDSHFATFPPDLIKPCILAGTKPGDVVLDPFGGSGTTGMVALELGRRAVLVELNPSYVDMIRGRCSVTPGLALDTNHAQATHGGE